MANPNPVQTEKFKNNTWKKGESGNPKGKPKGSVDTAKLIERILNKIVKTKDPFTGENTEITAKEALVLKQFAQAIQGDHKSFDRLFDRLDGKPKQSVEQTNINLTPQDIISRLDQEENEDTN